MYKNLELFLKFFEFFHQTKQATEKTNVDLKSALKSEIFIS